MAAGKVPPIRKQGTPSTSAVMSNCKQVAGPRPIPAVPPVFKYSERASPRSVGEATAAIAMPTSSRA